MYFIMMTEQVECTLNSNNESYNAFVRLNKIIKQKD